MDASDPRERVFARHVIAEPVGMDGIETFGRLIRRLIPLAAPAMTAKDRLDTLLDAT